MKTGTWEICTGKNGTVLGEVGQNWENWDKIILGELGRCTG